MSGEQAMAKANAGILRCAQNDNIYCAQDDSIYIAKFTNADERGRR
jgi:hypothetical protein